VQDGPVTLIPYENSHAKGGFAVRVVQAGIIVGLISAGEEILCRKLRVRYTFGHTDCRLKDGLVT
jgi:hypothetical protein